MFTVSSVITIFNVATRTVVGRLRGHGGVSRCLCRATYVLLNNFAAHHFDICPSDTTSPLLHLVQRFHCTNLRCDPPAGPGAKQPTLAATFPTQPCGTCTWSPYVRTRRRGHWPMRCSFRWRTFWRSQGRGSMFGTGEESFSLAPRYSSVPRRPFIRHYHSLLLVGYVQIARPAVCQEY